MKLTNRQYRKLVAMQNMDGFPIGHDGMMRAFHHNKLSRKDAAALKAWLSK